MALVECSECRKEISEQSTSCVHCGVPLKPQTEDETKTPTWIRIAQVYIIIAVFRAILTPHEDGIFYSLGLYLGEPIGVIIRLLF